MLSHVLNGNMDQQVTTTGRKQLGAESMEMISYILTELHNRIDTAKVEENSAEIKKPNLLESLYGDVCLAVLSR